MNKITLFRLALLGCVLIILLSVGPVRADEPSSVYLKYQDPQPTATSWAASGAYIVTLLLTFFFVIGLAYFASRFLGQKMGQRASGVENRIYSVLYLGNNRAVYVIEIAGRFLVIGVTDHNIALLREIDSPEEILKLRANSGKEPAGQFDSIFRRHLASLNQMTNKFPITFGSVGSAGPRDANQTDMHEKR